MKLVTEVELSEQLPAITQKRPIFITALVLLTWYTEPLAVVDVPLAEDGSISAEDLAAALWPHARAAIGCRFAAAGEPAPEALPVDGLRLTGYSPYLRGRAGVLAAARPASVIVCTRDRAERLASCLDAVAAQEYPDFEVIVVDNAPPADSETARLIANRSWPVPVRRIVENRPGLSWARNAGLRAATGRFVAYLDDDERPGRHWLAELARGFTLAPGVGGVSGVVLPAVLDTGAQCLFERFGGHSKGRGFAAEVFDAASHARQHPLYPVPPFGVGASMAFDREMLLRSGGFDVALGAGTPARAGEDTAAIGDLMLAGGTFVYWPGAVMWHEHRRELPELEHQLFGYGAGLTAFYLRAVLRSPCRLLTLARLAPRAIRDLRGAAPGDFPSVLRRARLRGMLVGPGRYLRSVRVQRRLT